MSRLLIAFAACAVLGVVAVNAAVCPCNQAWSDCLKQQRRGGDNVAEKQCAKKCLAKHKTSASQCIMDAEMEKHKAETAYDQCYLDAMNGAIGCSRDGRKGPSYDDQLRAMAASGQFAQVSGGDMGGDEGSMPENFYEKMEEAEEKIEVVAETFESKLETLLAGTGVKAFGECYDECMDESSAESGSTSVGDGEAQLADVVDEIEAEIDEEVRVCAKKFSCEPANTDLLKLGAADEKCDPEPAAVAKADDMAAGMVEFEEDVDELKTACQCAGKGRECDQLLKDFKQQIVKIIKDIFPNETAPTASALIKRRRRKRSTLLKY